MRRSLVTAVALFAAGIMALGMTGNSFAQDEPPHPAHVHAGSCATLGEVVAPLTNISSEVANNGTPMAMSMVGSPSAIPVMGSITTVDMALADMVADEHAINVHESAENIGNYIACGDIGGMMLGETDLLIGIAPLNGSNISGIGSLHDNGDGTTTVYVYLTHMEGGMATPVATPMS